MLVASSIMLDREGTRPSVCRGQSVRQGQLELQRSTTGTLSSEYSPAMEKLSMYMYYMCV